MDYFANAFKTRIVKPGDSPPAIGVQADPDDPRSLIGIAFPISHVGGVKWFDDPGADYPPPEVVWRLQIDRAWVDGKVKNLEEKETLEDRFVLRSGRFVVLAEDAV